MTNRSESHNTHVVAPGSSTCQTDSGQAWVITAFGFVVLFVSFGIAYSFGVFFIPIAQTFGARNGSTSAIFSITSLAFFSLGGLTGPLSDRWGPRPFLVIGAMALSCGLALMSVSPSLWFAYMSYGLGVGIGVGCVYVPLVSTVSAWFDRSRGLAVGILVSGIGLGTLLVAPLSEQFILVFGWRSTQLIYAVTSLVCLLGAAFVVRAAPEKLDSQRVVIRGVISSRAFILLYASTMLTSVVLYVPLVHLPVFAQQQGYAPRWGALLVALIGMTSIIGRLGLGGLGGDAHLLLLYKGTLAVVGLSYLCWLTGGGLVALVFFAALLGLGYGGFIALLPLVLSSLFGAGRLGTLLGIQYTAVGLGAAAGPFFVGVLRDTYGSYQPAVVTMLCVGLIAAAITLPVKRN